MTMTDPIADMLTRIRNACGSKHRRVDMPASKMKLEIARLLKANNFITDFKTVAAADGRPLLRVVLNKIGEKKPITEPALVSALKTIKTLKGPQLLHVITTKGKSYRMRKRGAGEAPAAQAPEEVDAKKAKETKSR